MQQFADEATAVRWPMYHGAPRGEGHSGLAETSTEAPTETPTATPIRE
jgi:hypothetical protein